MPVGTSPGNGRRGLAGGLDADGIRALVHRIPRQGPRSPLCRLVSRPHPSRSNRKCPLRRTSSSSTARGPTAPAGAPSSSACRPTATTSPRPSSRLTALADDVARLRHVLRPPGAARRVVAGHSYGGQIITALGTDAPNVVGLVYIAAFGLDEGESIGGLLAQGPPTPGAGAPQTSTTRASPGCPRTTSSNHFAADVDPVKARVMHAVQQPLHCLRPRRRDGRRRPGSRCRPGSWSPTATRRSRPTPSGCSPQRMGATTVEVATNHVAMVSHPDDVVDAHRDRRRGGAGRGDVGLRAPGKTGLWRPTRSTSAPCERVRKLIDARQYVLAAGGASPARAAARTPTSSRTRGRSSGVAPRADRGRERRDEGAVRVRLRRPPPPPPMGLIACQYRAAEWRHKEIELAAHELLQRLDARAAGGGLRSRARGRV